MTVPILLDGAMGTELMRRGVRLRAPLGAAAAVHDDPDTVRAIHRAYAEAGAQVLTTATLCAHAGEATATRALVLDAVRLCREAAGTGGPLIAGSIGARPGPAVSSRAAYRALAGALADAACDVLLVETMTDLEHASVAVKAAQDVADGRPVWLAVACGPGGALLGGATIDALFAQLDVASLGAIVVGCTEREGLAPALEAISARRPGGVWLGAYPNAGRTVGGVHDPLAQHPAALAETLQELAALHDLDIVGGCCGTDPAFIADLRQRVQRSASRRARSWARLLAARRR